MIDIIRSKIKWNGQLIQLDRNYVDGIALHHMAHQTWNFYDVDKAHKSKGWIGIGYNWWIAYDGTIYEGRGFNKGAGVANHNSHLISIGFQGDYQNKNKEMPKSQYYAGVKLIRWLIPQLPNLKIIEGHEYWNKTQCPGKYFPKEEMIKDAWEEMEECEMRYYRIDEVPEYAKPTIQKLIDKGILKGTNDGLDLSLDMIRMLVFNDRAGLYD